MKDKYGNSVLSGRPAQVGSQYGTVIDVSDDLAQVAFQTIVPPVTPQGRPCHAFICEVFALAGERVSIFTEIKQVPSADIQTGEPPPPAPEPPPAPPAP